MPILMEILSRFLPLLSCYYDGSTCPLVESEKLKEYLTYLMLLLNTIFLQLKVNFHLSVWQRRQERDKRENHILLNGNGNLIGYLPLYVPISDISDMLLWSLWTAETPNTVKIMNIF